MNSFARGLPLIVLTLLSFVVELGAVDYLVKPIKMNDCKSLAYKMKERNEEISEEVQSVLTGMDKYEKLRPLGQGASGQVCLYKNKLDGKLYAIKEIVVQGLDTREKTAAQNETSFTKVLKGPTII